MVIGVSRGGLFGRQAELGRLIELLSAAADGLPVVALVDGDAGLGKTRLVSELAVAARERGFAVLSGRCAELTDTIPYLPLADALRDAATGPSPAGPLLDALAARPVLGRLLPDRQGGGQGDGDDALGIAQQQLFGAVLGMLAELAVASPVLLVLEDLHWADGSTRDLVTFLSRVLHRERLAMVATYRTDDLHRRHPLRPVIAELLRLPSVTSIHLGPLDSAAIAEHLTSLSSSPLAAQALEEMITLAEGNPYYAEELLAASASGSRLPTGLTELLVARMEELPGPAQQVLRAAAVTGRRVNDELVRQTSGLAPPEYEQAVREAVAHQLLVPDGEQGFAFRHALLREAIYADLMPGERTRLHARLAGLLSDKRRLAEVPGTAAELAHHYLASHDIAGAFAASVMAGQEAEQLAAPAEAHRHYDQALSLWERVSGPEKLGGLDRGTLAFRSALCAADSGDPARAVHQLRRLLGFLGDAADPMLFSRVSERLSYLQLEIGENDAALTAASAAVDVLPEDPPSGGRARALAAHAHALLSMEDPEPARARAQEAQAAARAAKAPSAEADALVTLGLVSERTGQQREAISLFTKAHKQARTAAVLRVELRAAFELARVLLEWGDLDAARSTAHQGISRVEQTGLSMAPYGLDLRYLHYLVHYADGSWDHAQEVADTFAVRVASAAEARLSAMALFTDVAQGGAAVAERRAWLEPFYDSDRFAEYIGRGLLAEHALWQGDGDAAIAEAQATIRAIEAWDKGYGPPVIRVAAVGLSALGDRARQARAGGDAERADAALAEARSMLEIARLGAANKRSPRFVLGVDGRGWLARAEAEWRRANDDNDPAAWQAVVDAFGAGFVYESARSRWRLAEALAEAGDRAAAQREWLLAAQAAAQLRAAPLQAALASLARRARLGAPQTRPGRGQAWPGGSDRDPLASLTGRELEVLRLLAAGHSNKEIGAELFISAKTASVHVSNILAKLGAGGRTEAAAMAHRAGIGMPGSNSR
jgi:DNA-binding NarL/FixJ family response regulator